MIWLHFYFISICFEKKDVFILETFFNLTICAGDDYYSTVVGVGRRYIKSSLIYDVSCFSHLCSYRTRSSEQCEKTCSCCCRFLLNISHLCRELHYHEVIIMMWWYFHICVPVKTRNTQKYMSSPTPTARERAFAQQGNET